MSQPVRAILGDSREVLRTLDANSIDSCVTDPPYALLSGGGPNAVNKANRGQTASPYAHQTGFMGMRWDTGETAFDPAFWAEVLRVLKPGAHLLAFGGTRTYHRLACAIEDAGFEVRDAVLWHYGSGFPKSHDVSKGIDRARDDKADIHHVCAFVAASRDRAGKSNREIDALFSFNGMAGHWTNSKGPQAQVPRWEQWQRLKAFLGFDDDMDAEVWRLNGRKGTPGEAWKQRDVIGKSDNGIAGGTGKHAGVADAYGFNAEYNITAPATDAARQWEGWGSALKPATEIICLARKPLSEATIAANVLRWGTGALNIDGCRVGTTKDVPWSPRRNPHGGDAGGVYGKYGAPPTDTAGWDANTGRWPANLILSWPEDEYALRSGVTVEQKRELFRWFHDNA